MHFAQLIKKLGPTLQFELQLKYIGLVAKSGSNLTILGVNLQHYS